MTNNKRKTSDNKIIGSGLIIYGLFYSVFLHENIMKYGIDWMIMGLFGMDGLPHHLHKPFGWLIIILGVFMIMGIKHFNFLNGKK